MKVTDKWIESARCRLKKKIDAVIETGEEKQILVSEIGDSFPPNAEFKDGYNASDFINWLNNHELGEGSSLQWHRKENFIIFKKI